MKVSATISQAERAIVGDLAKQVAEIAALPAIEKSTARSFRPKSSTGLELVQPDAL